MKTKFCFLALATVALALGSCSESENGEGTTAKYITVSTEIGSMSRVVNNDDGTQKFAVGDQISVYAWTGSASTPILPTSSWRVARRLSSTSSLVVTRLPLAM